MRIFNPKIRIQSLLFKKTLPTSQESNFKNPIKNSQGYNSFQYHEPNLHFI